MVDLAAELGLFWASFLLERSSCFLSGDQATQLDDSACKTLTRDVVMACKHAPDFRGGDERAVGEGVLCLD